MPYSTLTNSLAPLISDGDTIWNNMLGVIAAITGLSCLVGMLLRQVEEISGLGIAVFWDRHCQGGSAAARLRG